MINFLQDYFWRSVDSLLFVFLLFRILIFFKGRKKIQQIQSSSPSLITAKESRINQSNANDVLVTDEKLIIHDSQLSREIQWSSVNKLIIETNDQGPFSEDIFIILVTDEEEIKISTLDQNVVEQVLTKFDQLGGFKYKQFNKAIACGENNRFLCWEKSV